MLSRFVVLSVSLTRKVSLLQGNIAKPATVAICCANHCADYGGQSFTYTNQPVDRNPSPERTTDAAGHAAAAASQDATLNWIVHPVK